MDAEGAAVATGVPALRLPAGWLCEARTNPRTTHSSLAGSGDGGGRWQVISLGVHTLPKEGVHMALMELLPFAVAKRTFPPVPSAHMVSPGYRQSPDISQWMVIMFAKVSASAAALLPPPPGAADHRRSYRVTTSVVSASLLSWRCTAPCGCGCGPACPP